jgi:hypothetical protein
MTLLRAIKTLRIRLLLRKWAACKYQRSLGIVLHLLTNIPLKNIRAIHYLALTKEVVAVEMRLIKITTAIASMLLHSALF